LFHVLFVGTLRPPVLALSSLIVWEVAVAAFFSILASTFGKESTALAFTCTMQFRAYRRKFAVCKFKLFKRSGAVRLMVVLIHYVGRPTLIPLPWNQYKRRRVAWWKRAPLHLP
jgi:hypothetical protein